MSMFDDPDFDMFAAAPEAPPCDGGPDDPYWQTADGVRVRNEMDAVLEEQARQKSEQDAQAAERLKARRIELAEQAVEAAAKSELEKNELAQRWAREQAANEAARAAREEKFEAEWAARTRQDDDYRAFEVRLCFKIHGARPDGEALEAWHDPDLWELVEDDEAANSRPAANIVAGATAALSPWTAHYHSLGLIRADRANLFEPSEHGDGFIEPKFYLVHSADHDDLAPETLGSFPPVTANVAVPHGAVLTLTAEVLPTNSTMLFEAMRQGVSSVGQWGGEATPEALPLPDEGRNEWLARVSIPRDQLARQLAHWRRCGGNPTLFQAAGAATARVSRARPISWIVPGLIPRGYVSLLVGTKQAGKSTLLGEILATVDSECQDVRLVLGTEIEARGVGCLVSGEDGIDFVASRNAFYEPVHGEAQGYVFVTAERPWPEVLKLLYEIPEVDIIGIDGLRAVMPGDEDSSGAISQFFDELNALAQHHNCAIVLIHHLSKAAVRSLSNMLPAVRGSGAITDRVRVAIGMIDRGSSVTEVGIIKHNFPPSEVPWGQVNAGRLFRRDAASLTLVPADIAAPTAGQANSESIDARGPIFDAVAHYNHTGDVLRRTGRHELFERKWPPLATFSRSMIRDGVSALIAAGRVVDGQDGLRAIGVLSSAGLAQ